jgi:TetR/AcrR family transcriptional regulator
MFCDQTVKNANSARRPVKVICRPDDKGSARRLERDGQHHHPPPADPHPPREDRGDPRGRPGRLLQARLRGTTLDQIADAAGLSKPNLLYYFTSKEAIHRLLLERLLDTWLEPLRHLDPAGEPLAEIQAYVRRKLEMARTLPRESRLFANEILQGAPRIADALSGPLRSLVDQKALVIQGWARPAASPLSTPTTYLLDLGHHPALRRFRRPGQSRPRQRRRRPLLDAERFLLTLFTNGLRP